MNRTLKPTSLGNFIPSIPPSRDYGGINDAICILEKYLHGHTWLFQEAQEALDTVKVELGLMAEKDAQLDAVMASLTRRLSPWPAPADNS